MKRKDTVGDVIDLASRKPQEQLAWMGRLAKNSDGGAIATVANTLLILANDPALRGMLAFNAFTAEPLIMRAAPISDDGEPELPGPYPRTWEGADVTLVQAYLQRVWMPRISFATTEAAMITEAGMRQFHPIRDWLADLQWDGKARIDNWLVNAFDCEQTNFVRVIGAKFLIAAVRRIRRPGCKFDYLLVLEGFQGIGKSEALRRLFGDAWFSDDIPTDLSSKDAAMALMGVWGLELAEIDHLIRTEVETIKAFLSRSVDRYRPPYGRAYVARPRQGVLVGTTNLDDYLRDSTGNRRIWPALCRAADPAWVAGNRDQLWAEAAHREATGEAIWIEDEDVRAEATEAQADRMATDPWTDLLIDHLASRKRIRIHELLIECLGIPKERMDKRTEMRCAKVLRSIGWTKDPTKRRMNRTYQQSPVSTWTAPHITEAEFWDTS